MPDATERVPPVGSYSDIPKFQQAIITFQGASQVVPAWRAGLDCFNHCIRTKTIRGSCYGDTICQEHHSGRSVDRVFSRVSGNWFGLFRCSRGQPVFGEVICSGHLAIFDFAADDRNADIEQVKTSLEGLVRQITRYPTSTAAYSSLR